MNIGRSWCPSAVRSHPLPFLEAFSSVKYGLGDTFSILQAPSTHYLPLLQPKNRLTITTPMAKSTSQSDSDINENSSPEGLKTPPGETIATSYERLRQSRIAENKARLEALGLCKMAKSVIKEGNKRVVKGKGKQKAKREEDEEYKPNEEEIGNEDELDGSSDGSEEYEEEDEEKGVKGRKTRSRFKKLNNRKPLSKKKPAGKKPVVKPQLVDDEDAAFLQAIALSLKDKGFIKDEDGGTCGGRLHKSSGRNKNEPEMTGSDRDQDDFRKRKKSKSNASRIQMNEDDVVINFCLFDETGRGSITLNDLRRMASVHDFPWTDKELYDMISCYDSNADGKLSLEDFRNIVIRCNMLQGTDNA